jgi:imidazolonepropionase-like amidohydrolase
VIVEGEKIKAIGTDLEVPEGATVIDGSGKYLMPGLAEMHAHIPTDENGTEIVEETLFLYLSNGVTTIRGMLGAPYHLELRESVKKGEILGPRIYTSGPSFNGNSASSPDAGVAPDQNGFFGLNFTELADTSKIRELAQATKEAGVWVVPTQSLLERWVGPTPPETLGQQPEMKYMANQTVGGWVRQKNQFIHADNYTETKANRFNEIRRQIIKTLHDEGVGLLLGSDAPQVFNVPGFSIQHELDAMIKSGLTPYEALKIGTVNPAVYFDAEGEFGTLVPEAAADMILLNGNPLEDVKNVQRRAGVMVRGQWLSEEAIQQRLDEIAAKYTM